VSKGDEQSNKAQARALSEAGCKRLFEEKASGGAFGSARTASYARSAARRRHRKLDPKKRREIAESVLSGRKSGAEMARLYDISEPTVSRIVAEHRQKLETSHADQS